MAHILVLSIILIVLPYIGASDRQCPEPGCHSSDNGSIFCCKDAIVTPQNLNNITAKTVKLSNSNLSEITLNKINLSQVEELYIENCRGLKEIGVFDANNRSTKLTLIRSGITKIAPGAFDKLHGLKTLILSHNKLKTFPVFNEKNVNMTYLNLDGNEISKLKADLLKNIPNLEELTMNHNKLETFPVINEKNVNMKYLYLDGNEIGKLEADQLKNIPNLEKLTLEKNTFRAIPINFFEGATKIETLRFANTPITTIEKYTFANLHDLSYLDLARCGITKIAPGSFDNLGKLSVLNLRYNRLKHFPVFNFENSKMKTLHLDHNEIAELKSGQLKNIPFLKRIDLEYNNFKVIPNNFFTESNEIRELNFSGTPVRLIEKNAFVNLENLRTLTLDDTEIETFPGKGLDNLEYLYLRNTKRLISIPRSLPNIKKVVVSGVRSFLCCKFHLEWHNKYNKPKTIKQWIINQPTSVPQTTPSTNFTAPSPSSDMVNQSTTTIPSGFRPKREIQVLTVSPYFNDSKEFVTHGPGSLVHCSPGPNAFQPCENIMGATWLTAVSFIVAAFALCGNFIVIMVFLCLSRHYNVSRFLVTNLAIADMCMGVYLLSLVIESVVTSGEYYNHAMRFQYGVVCNVLGFLAVFSGELSVYSLTMITVERYLTIVYALYPGRRMTMKHAIILMAIGWALSLSIALLPIFGVSSYTKVAICLPFEVENGGKFYLLFMFCFNGLSFIFIAVLYARMHRSVFVANNPTPTRRHDARVARRMAILVITDFACFAPITVAALSAMFGDTIISVSSSKYLLVFFFPLNSFMNPFLYALITKSFRRDLATLLKNCFVCGESFTGYLASLSVRSVPGANIDALSRTRQSIDFTLDFQGSAGNVHGEIPGAVSFSKTDPDLVKFHNLAVEPSNHPQEV